MIHKNAYLCQYILDPCPQRAVVKVDYSWKIKESDSTYYIANCRRLCEQHFIELFNTDNTSKKRIIHAQTPI